MDEVHFTVKLIKSGSAKRDGCYVEVKSVGNLLELTLTSNLTGELLDQRIVEKAELAQALDGWADY